MIWLDRGSTFTVVNQLGGSCTETGRGTQKKKRSRSHDVESNFAKKLYIIQSFWLATRTGRLF